MYTIERRRCLLYVFLTLLARSLALAGGRVGVLFAVAIS